MIQIARPKPVWGGSYAPLILLLVSLAFCFGFASCTRSDHAQGSAVAMLDGSMIEARQVIESDDSDDSVVLSAEYRGQLLQLGEPEYFHVAAASMTTDAIGNPAVQFEITEADMARYVEWTTSKADKRVAFLVGGTVLTAARITRPLPGAMIIGGFGDEAETQRVVSILREGGGGGAGE